MSDQDATGLTPAFPSTEQRQSFIHNYSKLILCHRTIKYGRFIPVLPKDLWERKLPEKMYY